jgi:hypothetical protein
VRTREEILEYQKQWYRENRDEVLRKHKERRTGPRKDENNARTRELNRQYKRDVMDHYGGKCACCGEDRIEFLAIDHINGNGNQHRRENNLRSGLSTYRWLIKNNYPSGFQALCHNCNAAKGYYGYCPHQRKEAPNT